MLHNKKRDAKKELNEFNEICSKISILLDNDEETIMAADWNIDLSAINKEEKEKTQTQKGQNRLIKILKDKLIDKGMILMNNTNTYHKGEYSSALDGIFTNKPNKIKFVNLWRIKI